VKLKTPFVQLPLLFDARTLLAEISALDASCWRDHPQKFPGNFALPLISAHGDPDDDGFAGPMRPTPYLEHCPYLMQVLERIGGVWGRTRLMKLSGHAEVSPHVDFNYYWRDRVRVHVPVVTQPTVRFLCGDQEVNMQAGECWIFDTWSQHRVINAADDERIHLVADTVGSERFWSTVEHGRVPSEPTPQNWQPTLFDGSADQPLPRLPYESVNLPDVMSPWELKEHLDFLLADVRPHEQLAQVEQIVARFIIAWRELWSEHGNAPAAWPIYRDKLNAFEQLIRRFAGTLRLNNDMPFMAGVNGLILMGALGDRLPQPAVQQRAGAAS
jgi:hypothetical protein